MHGGMHSGVPASPAAKKSFHGGSLHEQPPAAPQAADHRLSAARRGSMPAFPPHQHAMAQQAALYDEGGYVGSPWRPKPTAPFLSLGPVAGVMWKPLPPRSSSHERLKLGMQQLPRAVPQGGSRAASRGSGMTRSVSTPNHYSDGGGGEAGLIWTQAAASKVKR